MDLHLPRTQAGYVLLLQKLLDLCSAAGRAKGVRCHLGKEAGTLLAGALALLATAKGCRQLHDLGSTSSSCRTPEVGSPMCFRHWGVCLDIPQRLENKSESEDRLVNMNNGNADAELSHAVYRGTNCFIDSSRGHVGCNYIATEQGIFFSRCHSPCLFAVTH